jgi:hypothetical protein
MNSHLRVTLQNTVLISATALAMTSVVMGALRQASANSGNSAQVTQVSAHDRWLHVRVTNPDSKDETVRVNVPLELAEKVLPTINRDRLHNGKVRVDQIDAHGIDIRALLDAIRTSKDGEFVTVQNKESDVRVSKQNGYIFVHVFEKNHPKKSEVEVKVPIKVVDALFSAGSDELDLVAGLRALSAQGDTELVTVKDNENNVRVWLDSKNISD